MQSIIQILKLNEPKKGVSSKTGRPYDMRDAECMLLTEAGDVDQVGVLQIPQALREKVEALGPGKYLGSFALHADFASRRIGAVLTDLNPLTPQRPPQAAAKA